MSSKRYFSVECKCGHAGSRMYYIPIKFAIVAENGKEAAAKGRWNPRAKHHHKDCVLRVTEISELEYYQLLSENRNDPYLSCCSIQEQRILDLEERKVLDPHYFDFDEREHKDHYQKHPTFAGKTMIRNPRRYIRNYSYEEVWA